VRPPGGALITRTAPPTASALFGGEFAADILQRPRAGAVSVEGRIYGSVDQAERVGAAERGDLPTTPTPPTAWLLKASAADLIQRPSVRVVLLNERRGRREELNLPTAPIDRGDLDLRPTRFNGQVSAWFLLPIPKSHRISAIETPRFVGFCITQMDIPPSSLAGLSQSLRLRRPISVPAMPRPRSWARALMEAIGRLSFTIINVRLFPVTKI
jgi:hypothetical protein